MNELIETVKEDARSWWKELLTRKPLMNCTLEELQKKLKRSKTFAISCMITAILIWFSIMDLFLEGKTSITLNTTFLLLFIAGFSEIIQNHQIQLFIYLKKKEVKIMEKFPWTK